MVNLKTDSIPQLWSKLPFINQSRSRSFQQFFRRQRSQFNILLHTVGIIHINDTPGMLLSCGGLSTPFRALYQHSTRTAKPPAQQFVCYPIAIILFHTATYYRTNIVISFLFRNLARFYSATWRIFVPQLGTFLFRNLAEKHFCKPFAEIICYFCIATEKDRLWQKSHYRYWK